MVAIALNDYVRCGTRVVNTGDVELGSIMNGFAFDPAAGWYEYEVETKYAIERWLPSDFVLLAEIAAAV